MVHNNKKEPNKNKHKYTTRQLVVCKNAYTVFCATTM